MQGESLSCKERETHFSSLECSFFATYILLPFKVAEKKHVLFLNIVFMTCITQSKILSSLELVHKIVNFDW